MAKRYKLNGQEISKDQYDQLSTINTLGKSGFLTMSSARPYVAQILLTKPNKTQKALEDFATGSGTTTTQPQTNYNQTGTLPNVKLNNTPKTNGVTNSGTKKEEVGTFGFGSSKGQLFGEGGLLGSGGLVDSVSLAFRGIPNNINLLAQTALSGKPLVDSSANGRDNVMEQVYGRLHRGEITREQYARELTDIGKQFGNVGNKEIAAPIQNLRPILMSQEQSTKRAVDPLTPFKDAATIGSFAVPGGGSLIGAGGAKMIAGGALQGFGLSESGKEIQDTLLGGVGGFVGGAALKGAGKLARTIGKVGTGTENSVFKVSEKLLNKQGRAATPTEKKLVEKELRQLFDESADLLKANGMNTRTPRNVLDSASVVRESIEKSIPGVYDRFGATVDKTNIIKTLKDKFRFKSAVMSGDKINLGNEKGQALADIINQLDGEIGPKVRVSDLRSLITNIQDEMANSSFATDSVGRETDKIRRQILEVLKDNMYTLMEQQGDPALTATAKKMFRDLSNLKVIDNGILNAPAEGIYMNAPLINIGKNLDISPVTSRLKTMFIAPVEKTIGKAGNLNTGGVASYAAPRVGSYMATNMGQRPTDNTMGDAMGDSQGTQQLDQQGSTEIGANNSNTSAGYFTIPYAETDNTELKSILSQGILAGDITAADAKTYLELMGGKGEITKDEMKVNNAAKSLNNLKKLWDDVVENSPIGRLGGIGTSLAAMLGADPKAKAYMDIRTSIRAELARVLGEVGNLAQSEQEAALDLVPSIYDTPEEARIKWQGLKDRLSALGL